MRKESVTVLLYRLFDIFILDLYWSQMFLFGRSLTFSLHSSLKLYVHLLHQNPLPKDKFFQFKILIMKQKVRSHVRDLKSLSTLKLLVQALTHTPV